MELIEAAIFTKLVQEYLTEDEYRALQTFLINSPESGDLIAGTGGFRKIRWGDSSRGKGKRGGTRIIYYYFDHDQQLWLVMIYNKNEMSDLTPSEKKVLKARIDHEKELRSEPSTKRIIKKRK